MKLPPFVVELTGARGVGKSTTAGLIKAELTSRGVPFNVAANHSGFNSVTLRFSTAAAARKLEQHWRLWGVDTPEALSRYRERFRHYQVRRLRYSRKTGIFLIDEGIFQLMMMIAIRSGYDLEDISRTFSRLVPMPDIVISVEASEDEIAARRRMRHNAGDLLKPDVSDRSREGLKRTQAYLRCLPESGGTTSVIIGNSATANLETTVARAVDQIITAYDERWPRHELLLSDRVREQAP